MSSEMAQSHTSLKGVRFNMYARVCGTCSGLVGGHHNKKRRESRISHIRSMRAELAKTFERVFLKAHETQFDDAEVM